MRRSCSEFPFLQIMGTELGKVATSTFPGESHLILLEVIRVPVKYSICFPVSIHKLNPLITFTSQRLARENVVKYLLLN